MQAFFLYYRAILRQQELAAVVTGDDFRAAISKVAHLTLQLQCEAGFVVYNTKSAPKVSRVIHSLQPDQRQDDDLIGNTIEAMIKPYGVIYMDTLTDLNFKQRNNIAIVIHSHYTDPNPDAKEPLVELRPSTNDLDAFDKLTLANPGHVEGVLTFGTTNDIAHVLLYRRAHPDMPAKYQQESDELTRERTLTIMRESGFGLAELQYDRTANTWLDDIALQLGQLYE